MKQRQVIKIKKGDVFNGPQTDGFASSRPPTPEERDSRPMYKYVRRGPWEMDVWMIVEVPEVNEDGEYGP